MPVNISKRNMIEQQIRPWNMTSSTVVDAFYAIDRHEFVEPYLQSMAYADIGLEVNQSLKMLEPKVEAKLLQSLDLSLGEKVLKIGSDTGFLTALLDELTNNVEVIDQDPKLCELELNNLAKIGKNIKVTCVDGLSKTYKSDQLYDAIVITKALTSVPQHLLNLLNDGGSIFAFIMKSSPVVTATLINKHKSETKVTDLFEANIEFKPAEKNLNEFVF